MSESIYTLLDTLRTETSVPHATIKMQSHTLPRGQFPTADQFEDETELMAWAQEHECLHACMQKGIRAHIIDMRARFKSFKKNTVWTSTVGQKNIDKYRWEVQTRPTVQKSEEQIAHEYLSKLSPDALARILAAAATK